MATAALRPKPSLNSELPSRPPFAQTGDRMYRLVFQSGRYEGKRIVVSQAVALAGRDSSCHLVLSGDDRIAPRHVRLEENATGIFVSALSPQHPVRVNGNDIFDSSAKLRHGDVVEIGQTLVQFQNIIAPHQRLRQSHGLLQPATILFAAAILCVEAALLFFLVDWPSRLIRPATEARDISIAESLRAASGAKTKSDGSATPPSKDSVVVKMPGTSSSVSSNSDDVPSDPAHQVLQVADFAPANTNSSIAILPAVSAADSRIEDAQRLLAQASSAAGFADYSTATRILNQIHQMEPGFLPAHVQHARLLEARGDLGGALQRWALVLGTAPENSQFRKQAAEERDRLFRLRDAQTQIADRPAVANLDQLPRHVRVVSSDIQRLPADSDVAEMRVLSIELASPPDSPLYKNAVLQVFVTFYDLLPDGQTRPTRAIVTPSPIVVESPFASGRSLSIEATYVVPRGLRSQERNAAGESPAFYGYTIHAFAGKNLQDAFGKPRKLLDLPLYVPSSGE